MDFWPKMAKFGPKLDFLAKYWRFWPIWSHGREKETMWTKCLGGFSVICRMVHFIPCPTKNNANRIFGPKTTKFGPKLAFLAIYWHFWPIWSHAREEKKPMWTKCLGSIGRLIWCPVVWLVGWWLSRVGCMSQDTYLLSSNIVLPNTFVKFFFLIYFPVSLM